MVLTALASIMRPQTKIGWGFYAAGWIALMASLLLTYSQSAQIGFAVGAIAFGVIKFSPPSFLPWLWRAFGVFLVVITIAWPFASPFAYKTIASDLEEVPVISSGAPGHRLQIWDSVSRLALKKPFFGHGIEATRAAGQMDTDHRFATDGATIHPHNAPLQIWVEFGAFGIMCFSVGILVLTELAARKSVSSLYLAAAICVPLLAAYGLWQNWWLGVIFASIAIALVKTPSRQE